MHESFTPVSELKHGQTLSDALGYFDVLSRERNRKFLRLPSQATGHLLTGTGEMQELFVRLAENPERIRALFPEVASRVALQIITTLQSVDTPHSAFIEIFSREYGGKCKACGQPVCVCGLNNTNAGVESEALAGQETWGIAEWQAHMQRMYGANNLRMEPKDAAIRLTKEATEANWEANTLTLETLEHLVTGSTMTPERERVLRMKILKELSDVFAWLLALCNKYGADLEEILVTRYADGCPNCGRFVCECGDFKRIEARKNV